MNLYISVGLFIIGNFIFIKLSKKGCDPDKSTFAYLLSIVSILLILIFGYLSIDETLKVIGVYGETDWIVTLVMIGVEYGIYKIFVSSEQEAAERLKNEEQLRQQVIQEMEMKLREDERNKKEQAAKELRKNRIISILKEHKIENIEDKLDEFNEFIYKIEEYTNENFEERFCEMESNGVYDSVSEYLRILRHKFQIYTDYKCNFYPNKANSPFFERWYGPEEDAILLSEDPLELLVLYFLNYDILKDMMEKIILEYNIINCDLNKFVTKMMNDYAHYATYPLDHQHVKEFILERSEIVHKTLLSFQHIKIILPELESIYLEKRDDYEYEGVIYSDNSYLMLPGDKYIIDFGEILYDRIRADLGIEENVKIYFSLEKPVESDIETGNIKLYKQGDYIPFNEQLPFELELYVVVKDEDHEILYC